ncbi:GNAT family N-acetyltransferase [Nocardioides sp.]|uniref:GNAT family N-acetyltransferase n=1 Tax=Nocardioides sp. TaxID=35761 RepID=UPI002D7EC1C9|nr:GNAT family N-acetyltransferase [Nocardioides sp.]HET8960060.1 GNAT family N-acetyltransferase [Nocardioides sp.]
MSRPSADVSVRVAWPDDADAIAALQARAWRTSYDGVLPPEALEIDPTQAAELWRTNLARPRDARTRVLVALERNRVVGFAITTPATDPDCDPAVDAELMELTVEPVERGRGHGSRLVQAAVETMAADKFTRAVLWAVATDESLREFLTGAGWAPDTAHRELDLEGDGATLVKQIRLHTDVAPAS